MDRAFQVGKKRVPPCSERHGPFALCINVHTYLNDQGVFYYLRRTYSGIRSALNAFRFVLAPLP